MSGEERTEMFSTPLEQQEYDRQAAIDDAEMDHIYSDSVLHWRTRALDLEARLAAATRLAESRAVEVAELRTGIERYIAHDPPCATNCASLDPYPSRGAPCDCGLQAFMDRALARPADARGTEE